MTIERQMIISLDEKGNISMKTDKFVVLEILGMLEVVKYKLLSDNTTDLSKSKD